MQELPPYLTKAQVVQLLGLEAFWLDLPLPVFTSITSNNYVTIEGECLGKLVTWSVMSG